MEGVEDDDGVGADPVAEEEGGDGVGSVGGDGERDGGEEGCGGERVDVDGVVVWMGEGEFGEDEGGGEGVGGEVVVEEGEGRGGYCYDEEFWFKGLLVVVGEEEEGRRERWGGWCETVEVFF